MEHNIRFFPDGSYDQLLYLWWGVMLEVGRNAFSRIQHSPFHAYESYLPPEKFQEVDQIGFQMIKDSMSDKYLDFVFDIFYSEGIRENYSRLQMGELRLLKYLFFSLLVYDLDLFSDLYITFCSSKMNKIISTELYHSGLKWDKKCLDVKTMETNLVIQKKERRLGRNYNEENKKIFCFLVCIFMISLFDVIYANSELLYRGY